MSRAAISDHVFVETHDPNNAHQAMGRTLYDVVPPCLDPALVDELADVHVPPFDTNPRNVLREENQGFYPIHIEAGKRVYQLYAELDHGDDHPDSLATKLKNERDNDTYLGPWALPTMGDSGGQTVFGALTTGTHGGDFLMPPLADTVLALHLVADGGKHYWIEPSEGFLTVDEPLRALYGQLQFGGPGNFDIIRNDDVFNAVLVSVGRFGIVYSLVIRAVRQYSLHQEQRLTTWQDIKGQIANPESALYTQTEKPKPEGISNRYLGIAVSVTPHANFTKNLAAVTKRWNVPFAKDPDAPNEPAGRRQRRGEIVEDFDPLIQAPRFEFAGTSGFPFSEEGGPPSFLEAVCADADFMAGVINAVIHEVEEFIRSNGTVASPLILAVTVLGPGTVLPTLLPALTAFLGVLANYRLLGGSRLGQVLNDLRRILLDPPILLPPILRPIWRRAGLFVWQMIAYATFSSQRGNHDIEEISYAVMDRHDYSDVSCRVNGDSIEVFFDATDPMLIAYVDALLVFEINQEVNEGRAFVGYIALRFTGPTGAFIGPQRFERSCAVEVAGLRDVEGVNELMDYAITLALNSNFKGILHWGQRNESRRAHIEERFGPTPTDPTGDLHRWRQALSRITANGNLNGFSSAFTRRTGLEVV